MSEWTAKNSYLTQEQMENNARSFYSEMSGYGFSLNAISGMLGNIEKESGVNPGIWENLKPYAGGYGLVQWTPYTNYSSWAGSDWQNNGDKECERISYEFDNGLQYFPTSQYPLSAQDFKTSTLPPAYLATAFLYNYERPANKNQPARRRLAEKWYKFLSGEDPPKPKPDDPLDPTPPEPEQFPAWLLFKFQRS